MKDEAQFKKRQERGKGTSSKRGEDPEGQPQRDGLAAHVGYKCSECRAERMAFRENVLVRKSPGKAKGSEQGKPSS